MCRLNVDQYWCYRSSSGYKCSACSVYQRVSQDPIPVMTDYMLSLGNMLELLYATKINISRSLSHHLNRSSSTPSKASQLWKKSLKYRPNRSSKDNTHDKCFYLRNISQFSTVFFLHFIELIILNAIPVRLSSSNKHSSHLKVRRKPS